MEIVGREVIRRGAKFDLVVHRLRTPSGAVIEREFIDHPGSVVIVPLLSDHQVVLIDNPRHSIDRKMIELPAGTAQRGEPLEETAVRELEEETGYRAGRWTRLLDFHACPGATTERMRLFLAQDLSPGPTRHEIDEEMDVFTMTLADALSMTLDGRIDDSKTILGLWMTARLLKVEF